MRCNSTVPLMKTPTTHCQQLNLLSPESPAGGLNVADVGREEGDQGKGVTEVRWKVGVTS